LLNKLQYMVGLQFDVNNYGLPVAGNLVTSRP